MSVKGFFIAILCVVAGGFGAYYSLLGLINTTGSTASPTGWIVLLIISIIAAAFGMGVFANRIKL